MSGDARARLLQAIGRAFDAGVQSAADSHATRRQYRAEQQDAAARLLDCYALGDIQRVAGAFPELMPIRSICTHVAAEYSLPPHLLTAHWRRADIVEARHVAMWIARGSGWTLQAIGKVMGGRDHTSVIHALDRVRARRDADPDFRRRADRLVAELSHITEGED